MITRIARGAYILKQNTKNKAFITTVFNRMNGNIKRVMGIPLTEESASRIIIESGRK